MKFVKLIGPLLLTVSFGLYGCGGGGGSAGTPAGSQTLPISSTGAGGTTAVAPTTAASAPKLTVAVINQTGTSVTGIAVGGGFSAQAVLVDAEGVAVAPDGMVHVTDSHLLRKVVGVDEMINLAGHPRRVAGGFINGAAGTIWRRG